MIRGADLSHADICEISTELEAEENLDPQPPATFITTGAADCGGSCPRPIDTRRRLSCHISGIGLAGTWVRNSGRGNGTARLRDLRCVAAVARQARMLRSPKLQCESGRTARGSSRPRLRAPASGGHPSQCSTGRDRCCCCDGWSNGHHPLTRASDEVECAAGGWTAGVSASTR
jgi:hypothetical protein